MSGVWTMPWTGFSVAQIQNCRIYDFGKLTLASRLALIKRSYSSISPKFTMAKSFHEGVNVLFCVEWFIDSRCVYKTFRVQKWKQIFCKSLLWFDWILLMLWVLFIDVGGKVAWDGNGMVQTQFLKYLYLGRYCLGSQQTNNYTFFGFCKYLLI